MNTIIIIGTLFTIAGLLGFAAYEVLSEAYRDRLDDALFDGYQAGFTRGYDMAERELWDDADSIRQEGWEDGFNEAWDYLTHDGVHEPVLDHDRVMEEAMA